MKKILIISPINQWGGVNIDAGFMAEFYQNYGYKVKVLSLGDYYSDSSIFNFIPKKKYTTLNELVIRRYFFFFLILRMLNCIKPLDKPISHRVNNPYFKKYFGLKKKSCQILSQKIKESDVIFICHHLTGEFVEEIVSTSCKYSKTIFHRVTQQINEKRMLTPYNIRWLSKINTLIYHSKSNQLIAKKYLTAINHSIIDQCVINENIFLSKNVLNNCKSYYVLTRLENTKKIDQVISAFKLINDKELSLHIYGDGAQLIFLKELAAEDKRIKFYAPVTIDYISQVHLKHDCLIISSSIEGGPYTGLEAMAAGNLIVSTRVGAMEERLGIDYDFFYNSTQIELTEKIDEITCLSSEEIKKISCRLKELYLKNHSYKIIQRKYQDLIENID